MSLALSGKKLSEEHKEKLKGTKNGIGNKSRTGRTNSEQWKLKISEVNKGNNYNCKNIYKIITPNKTEFTISNLASFCRDYNLDLPCMYKVTQGKRKQHKGYTGQILNKLGE